MVLECIHIHIYICEINTVLILWPILQEVQRLLKWRKTVYYFQVGEQWQCRRNVLLEHNYNIVQYSLQFKTTHSERKICSEIEGGLKIEGYLHVYIENIAVASMIAGLKNTGSS